MIYTMYCAVVAHNTEEVFLKNGHETFNLLAV